MKAYTFINKKDFTKLYYIQNSIFYFCSFHINSAFLLVTMVHYRGTACRKNMLGPYWEW